MSFSASAWNAMLNAGRALKGQFAGVQAPGPNFTTPSTIVRVQNGTGAPLMTHSVLGVSEPIFRPTATSSDAFLREIAFIGVVPTVSNHSRSYVVTLEPAGVDQVVRAVIAGMAQVRIEVIHTAQGYVNVVDGHTGHMVTSHHGHARIFWDDAGAYGPYYSYGYDDNTHWAIVMLGVTGSSTAVGIANGNISHRVGTVLGTGSVDLTFESLGDEIPTGETITVFNNSAELTPAGHGIDDGTRVAIMWDAEDTAFVAPVECSNPPYYS